MIIASDIFDKLIIWKVIFIFLKKVMGHCIL